MSDTPQAETARKPGGARRPALLGLAAVVLLAGAGWAIYDFVLNAHTVSTDDAYVAGDVVQITSKVNGTVIALHADDTQAVKPGDLLIQLDPAEASISMATAEAGLAQAVRNVKALQAEADQLRAQIEARQADLRRAQDDAKRRANLIATGAVSREDFNHAQDTSTSQEAALAAARAQLDQVLAQ